MLMFSAPRITSIASLNCLPCSTLPERRYRDRCLDKIALLRCLRSLAKEATATRVKSLAMQRIASGTFGLDWSEVHGMLQSQLGDLVIPIFVYVQELEGQVASEPGM